MQLGNFQVHIFDASKGPRPGVPHHTLYVPWEKKRAIADLQMAGAKVDHTRDHADDKGYSLYVIDPEGNIWELSFGFEETCGSSGPGRPEFAAFRPPNYLRFTGPPSDPSWDSLPPQNFPRSAYDPRRPFKDTKKQITCPLISCCLPITVAHLASAYLTTLSARNRTDSGIGRPICLAAMRLTTVPGGLLTAA